jgi:hypothetical protein
MDGGSGPDAKKARWSPTSPSQSARPVDPFANYGYGPNASIQQQAGQAYGSSPSSPLYATPNLSINTNAAASSPVVGAMPSPNSAAFQQAQPGQASPITGNGQYGFGYNMIMPGMLNGFAYNGQMQGFNGQVYFFFLSFSAPKSHTSTSKTLPPVGCPSLTSPSPKHRTRPLCLALPSPPRASE